MKSIFFLGLTLFASITACGVGERLCNGQCYNPTVLSCLLDCTANSVLCPQNTQVCNGACYNPSSYHCAAGCSLAQGAAPAGTPTPTPATSSAAPTPAPTPTTSSAAPTPAPKPSTTQAANVAVTTSAQVAAPATSSPAVQQGGPSYQAPSPCTPASYCSSGFCSCNGACYTPGQYNCPTDQTTGKQMLCQGNYGACNGQCFDTTQQSCSNGQLVAGGSPLVTRANPTTSSVAAPATTGSSNSNPNPVVNPSPVALGFPTQTADLRIINSCKSTLWFEARYGAYGAPLPGQNYTSTMALPGSYVDYTVPDTGISGTRFWAKYGCDGNGRNCAIGDQMQYWPNPPGGCPANGCTPPVDSLFEATWGCRPGTPCNSANPTTWFDTSQVDGWTIPYKLTPVGDTSQCDCIGSSCGFSGIDASTLDLSKCPQNEDLTANGVQDFATVNGDSINLSSVDLRIINNGQVLGCMSPCKRLNWGTPYGLQQSESTGSTLWMCCPTPTPDNCQPEDGCVTPSECRAGPIESTEYVAAVHSMAPGVYSFSYDDGVGLHACPAGVTKYTMEFCPSGSAAYPATA